MSDGPFKIGRTTVGNPCVQNATGEILDVCINDEHARKSLGDALRVWHYAGGPALARQRDELRALLQEARDQFDYILSHVSDEAYPGMLSECRTRRDRLAAAIGGA